MAETEKYRECIIQMLPNLIKLDNKDIDAAERESAMAAPLVRELMPGYDLTDDEIDRRSGRVVGGGGGGGGGGGAGAGAGNDRPITSRRSGSQGDFDVSPPMSVAPSRPSSSRPPPQQPPPQQQQQQPPARTSRTNSNSGSGGGDAPHVLYAVLSLLNALDNDSLRVVQQEINGRLGSRG